MKNKHFLEFFGKKIFFIFGFEFITSDTFFCDLNISPPPGIRTPKPKFLKKTKQFLWKKSPWICTKKSQKPKAIPLNKKSPPSIRTPDLSTFTANLSKKIHAKNLKIFLKKTCFWGTKKGVFFGEGGKIPRKKCLDHKKKSVKQKVLSKIACATFFRIPLKVFEKKFFFFYFWPKIRVRIVYKNFVQKKKGYFFILELEFRTRTNKKSYQKSLALRFLGYL